ncbi:winged helix-turn-helix domain-containing protein [Candidatus Parcubacteria bacterium]|nr:winged helix-turn-helix domain-containing protein [Candidatus Parcubacteria bacterium]
MLSLRSKITRKVLGLLLQNESKEFYVNELAKKIGEDPSNVYKKLLELKKFGLLLDRFKAKERYFFLNKKYPLLKEYRKIILQGNSLQYLLKESLQQVRGVVSVFVLGVSSFEDISLKKPLDLLVIGTFKQTELNFALQAHQRSSGGKIKPVFLTERDFKRRLAQKAPLLTFLFSKPYFQLF